MSKSALIVEKNNFFLEALKAILSFLGFTVVGTSSKASEINLLALKTKPDLIVFDYQLSSNGMAGLADLKQLKEQLPQTKILVLGHQDATEQFTNAIRNAGLDGFWCKYDSRAGFINTLSLLFP